MSVYIKGMERPECCEECQFLATDIYGSCGCDATGNIPLRLHGEQRPKWCPLIPVPYHGRLIDADDRPGGFFTDYGEFVVSVNDLEEMPTIIPADKEDEP